MYICYKDVYISLCIKADMHVSVCVCIYECMNLCMFVGRWICMGKQVFMYVYKHTYYRHAYVNICVCI